jgi:hypothetical protein
MFRSALIALTICGTAFCEGKIAATVDGAKIELAEVDAILSGGTPPLTPPTAAQTRQRRFEAVNALVDDRLIRRFLTDAKVEIAEADVEKQFEALIAIQKKEGRTISEYCKDNGLTPERIKDNFRMVLKLSKLIESQIDDAKLKQYHEANRDFFDKATVRASHIVVRIANGALAEEREKARKKLEAIKASIESGKLDFAMAAKQHSQCPSAPKGGDIGDIVRKFQVDEAFAKAAFALKVEEISGVVESDFGMHLIRIADRKAGTPSKFADVANDVRDCYEAELKQNLLATLRKKAKVEITLP